ncbi:MAG: TIGR00153 family protein [Candidatus Eremiobacteraeota bacterium]|nr:TIGR00153 family protein [Candidatus Eremiobacteraeota bacterium]
MLFFEKGEKEVENLIFEHFQLVGETLDVLMKFVEAYIGQEKQLFKDLAGEVHEREHKADIVRRQIAHKLYGGVFLPIYREDYLSLVGLVDEVANQAEIVASFMILTRPEIPEFLKEDVHRLANAFIQAYQPMREALAYLSGDISKVMDVTQRIGEMEQKADLIEWKSIKRLYKSDLPLAEKNLLRELIQHLALISDLIEDVAERFDAMVIKRNI